MRDIFGNLDDGPDDVSGSTATNQLAENEAEIENLPILFDRFAPLPQNPTTEQINAAPSIPPLPSLRQTMVSPKMPTGPGRSMVHRPIQAKRWEMEPGNAQQYNDDNNGQVNNDGSRCKPVLLHVAV